MAHFIYEREGEFGELDGMCPGESRNAGCIVDRMDIHIELFRAVLGFKGESAWISCPVPACVVRTSVTALRTWSIQCLLRLAKKSHLVKGVLESGVSLQEVDDELVQPGICVILSAG